MPKERGRAIARMGGIAAHAQGRAHTYTHEEAIIAGRKGGRNGRGASKAHQRARL